MLDKILPVLAVLVLAGFLGILLMEVPRIDLGVVIAITLLLALVDIVRHHFRRR